MPSSNRLDPIRSMIQMLGQQIGQQIAAAAMANLPRASGRNVAVAGGCAVPGCTRAKAAKGLCQNHYAKAKRLKMGLEKLSASQLNELAQDGRSLRNGSASPATCSVAGCSRRHAAKGLCMNHYAKANRLKMNTDSLSAADMKKLATDLRGARA